MDAVERQGRRCVEADDPARLGDDEADLAAARNGLRALEVTARQLAERPEHVRPDGVEAGYELRELGVLPAAEPCADFDDPGTPSWTRT